MANKEEMEPVDKNQQDIIELRQDVKTLQSDVRKLQLNDIKQDEKIVNLQTTLSSIQDDTKWIRRMITKAIVTAVITGLISGAIALFFAKF
ncbi:hemolysin XhlA family protein [Oceanobacillus kimchii]|uniref:hemolysin XhlA family protein n=1 Tax=Oceanobacillus kimchii TaxID=746691 RepID=UPI0021A68E5E|nr:hemolysin XhlA family protein [Oceanobacillus kimchii]MCT1575709.1 hemolysin XhlA family protein [Oceanobacillus kimchii]MCT2138086.1 hemolysin XhlA family protein [Oceanobacillus kimchii]